MAESYLGGHSLQYASAVHDNTDPYGLNPEQLLALKRYLVRHQPKLVRQLSESEGDEPKLRPRWRRKQKARGPKRGKRAPILAVRHF